jgi:hypothetical protein
MTKRPERISSVLWVEIIPGRDGVLGGKRGRTVARGQRVLLEVVVAHQLCHACDVDDAALDSISPFCFPETQQKKLDPLPNMKFVIEFFKRYSFTKLSLDENSRPGLV